MQASASLILQLLVAACLLQLSSQQCQYRNGYIYECSHNELTRTSQLEGPESSRRDAVTTLDIAYNKIVDFDAKFLAEQFPGVRHLLAGNNLIESLPDPGSGLTWPDLEVLKLSHNRLEAIGRSDFAFGTGLVALHLDSNRIQALSRGCFSRCHNLSLLDLSNNKLDYLHSDYFWGLWTLEHLYLSHNQLSGLASDAFGHLHRLVSLDLGHNRVKSLAPSALRGLPALARLSLASNQLAEFPCDGLQSAPGLRWLDASGNLVHTLSRGAVTRLPALETLLLNASTELRLVDSGAFVGLPALRSLDASDSPALRFVSPSAFEACPELAELRLARCRLAAAPLTEWRRRLPRLSLADVADNPDVQQPSGGHPGGKSGGVLVLDLFPPEIVLSEGHCLRLPCRSYPEGRARWVLPPGGGGGGAAHVSTTHMLRRHHVAVTPEQDLLLHDAFDQMGGVYACVASDDSGDAAGGGNETALTVSTSAGAAARREVNIVVKRLESQLLLLKVTENSIVVTWQKLASPDDYLLMYRPRGATLSDHYNSVRLQSYMKRYSVSSLQPGSTYQLCLALRTYTDYQHLHCILATTRSTGDANGRNALFANGRVIIILVIGIAVSVGVLIACLIACSLSRDKEGDSWSQASLAGSHWSDSQPMTFENRAADEYNNLDSEAEDEEDHEQLQAAGGAEGGAGDDEDRDDRAGAMSAAREPHGEDDAAAAAAAAAVAAASCGRRVMQQLEVADQQEGGQL